MFSKRQNIILISKTGIEGFKVKLDKNPEITDRFKESCTDETLAQALAIILKNLKTKKVRLLLADDLTYVTKFTVPLTVQGEAERKYVFDRLQALVPELLTEDDWDYKELGSEDTEKEVICFVPVKGKFVVISRAFQENGCLVEAIESEAITRLSSPDPVIGLALKKDLKGKDSQTLNISLISAEEVKAVPAKNKRGVVKMIGMVLLILIIGLAVAFAYTRYYPRPKEKAPAITAAVSVTPTETPSPSPTPAPVAELNLEEYSVQVLNGSGINGEAARVAKMLTGAGIKEISTGNADSSDYKETVLKVKSGLSSPELLNRVREVIGEFDIEGVETLTSDSDFDLLIIVGKK